MRSGAESRTENLWICLYKRVMCGSKGDKKDARGHCVCTMVCNSVDILFFSRLFNWDYFSSFWYYLYSSFNFDFSGKTMTLRYNSLVTQVFEGNAYARYKSEGLFWVQRPDPNSKLMVVIITPLLRGRRHILTNNVISPPGHFANKK